MSKSNKNGGVAYFLRIAGVLTLICSFIALMLAVVNTVTKAKIEENTNKEKTEAVSRIFGDIDGVTKYDGADHEVLLVSKDGVMPGYCVTVKPQGYGGEIEMLVGITPDGAVRGVEIISMSETPGVGSRVKSDENFLPQFAGKRGPFSPGNGADAISGASISSKAVMEGINEALSVKFDLAAAAESAGLTLASPGDETSDTVGSETETGTETESASPAPAPAPETQPDTYVDPALVGGYGEGEVNPSDNIYVEERDPTYYLEHETTDTESETEVETDENGNPIAPETDENGNPVTAATDAEGNPVTPGP